MTTATGNLPRFTLPGSGRPRHARRRMRIALAAGSALVAAALAGCAPGSPQALLFVPGNYVAKLNGQASATVIMCLDEPSAVLLETGLGGDGLIGKIALDWSGTVHSVTAPGNGVGPVTLTTPVLQPGCGTLEFWVDCCHIDDHLAIKASKV
jgi:hypothetical protein